MVDCWLSAVAYISLSSSEWEAHNSRAVFNVWCAANHQYAPHYLERQIAKVHMYYVYITASLQTMAIDSTDPHFFLEYNVYKSSWMPMLLKFKQQMISLMWGVWHLLKGWQLASRTGDIYSKTALNQWKALKCWTLGGESCASREMRMRYRYACCTDTQLQLLGNSEHTG